MSVMAETSQSAMGPYVAMAAVGSVLYALTAVVREALVVKVVVSRPPKVPCRVERRERAMRGERHRVLKAVGGAGYARNARRTCSAGS